MVFYIYEITCRESSSNLLLALIFPVNTPAPSTDDAIREYQFVINSVLSAFVLFRRKREGIATVRRDDRVLYDTAEFRASLDGQFAFSAILNSEWNNRYRRRRRRPDEARGIPADERALKFAVDLSSG